MKTYVWAVLLLNQTLWSIHGKYPTAEARLPGYLWKDWLRKCQLVLPHFHQNWLYQRLLHCNCGIYSVGWFCLLQDYSPHLTLDHEEDLIEFKSQYKLLQALQKYKKQRTWRTACCFGSSNDLGKEKNGNDSKHFWWIGFFWSELKSVFFLLLNQFLVEWYKIAKWISFWTLVSCK